MIYVRRQPQPLFVPAPMYRPINLPQVAMSIYKPIDRPLNPPFFAVPGRLTSWMEGTEWVKQHVLPKKDQWIASSFQCVLLFAGLASNSPDMIQAVSKMSVASQATTVRRNKRTNLRHSKYHRRAATARLAHTETR
jgi:hypothetical protein